MSQFAVLPSNTGKMGISGTLPSVPGGTVARRYNCIFTFSLILVLSFFFLISDSGVPVIQKNGKYLKLI